jgi:hypothetical protein
VHFDDQIEYFSLFTSQEEFDKKFKLNKDIPDFMKEKVQFKGI